MADKVETQQEDNWRADMPAVTQSLLLSTHTTMRVGGAAKQLVVAETEAELIAAVQAADEAKQPVLILSGGSNIVAADTGFAGTVIKVATRGIRADVSACGGALVTVAAGEPWDGFVQEAVTRGWVGIEALSGIPGLVGSTPMQNVGAYGQEVAATIARVRTWDRTNKIQRTFVAAECDFSYRHSCFKAEPGRYVILEVTFQFELGELGLPIAYAELAKSLGVSIGERAPMKDIRAKVLELRRGKGMVFDETDPDTWSCGSFFTNPILSCEQAADLPAEAPRFAAGAGLVKSSAAWLIEHAGFSKGYGSGAAKLSTKHVLALTNRGSATSADVIELAKEIVAGVEKAYGIRLVPEPIIMEEWQ
ncbi:MAG: UDP-N-acetylmuramate dehydrogenase [Propionibacteriaceae bacterium]